jgi:hypothetical protein
MPGIQRQRSTPAAPFHGAAAAVYRSGGTSRPVAAVGFTPIGEVVVIDDSGDVLVVDRDAVRFVELPPPVRLAIARARGRLRRPAA